MIVAGDWKVLVEGVRDGRKIASVVAVPPPDIITVNAEMHERMPVYDPTCWAGWGRGIALREIRAQECSTKYALDPASLEVQSGPGAGTRIFERGKDYEADLDWGGLGRLVGGAIEEKMPVFVSYRYAKLRLDSVVRTKAKTIVLRKGKAHIAVPRPPELGTGEERLGNIWINGRLEKLLPGNLFPILESEYPEPAASCGGSMAERLLPQAMRRLKDGKRLKILAWGDSVTNGRYLPEGESFRWQVQFVNRLKERFPKAKIDLVTEAWAGRNTESYLAEPPNAEHNYQEKVLAAKPDLVISEFVNDASLNPGQVEERYSRFLGDFQAIRAEWIILTPHYVRPDWMGLKREQKIDKDPRPYVAGVRAFAEKHGIALADASLRYGRLWRQGIPYSSLMHNNINHPDIRGMKLFADSLMALFA